jgi:hypothetical protein
MESPITISDLYEGAYLLCRGFKLGKVTVVGNNGKKLCTFAFSEGAKEALEEYRQGRATCNVALLKFTMKNLKDEMFKRIREMERTQKEESCSASARRIG